MKASVQMYGIIVTFAVFIFLFPQLMGIAVLYRQCNSLASYLIEIIEVHEGINADNGASKMISDTLEKYPSVVCKTEKAVMDDFFVYNVQCSKEVKISIVNIPVEIRASKKTRRVIY
ncbi:MAG: hypothetical protein RR766_03555 [Longicatena sp.]|jgi:hypothetical protein|uniref:hypothetical protein n=1 Tax=Anaerorhabdus sp. TaxID=1872524 RepID=UPI002FCCAE63